jgi:IS30 family transposase
LFERQRIEAMAATGLGPREIGRRLGRAASTISRELRHNKRTWDSDYEAVLAHMRAHEQAKRPKVGKIESTPWLQRFIQQRLDDRWSPEQIHRHLQLHHGQHPRRQVCTETIYRCLYRPSDLGCHGR